MIMNNVICEHYKVAPSTLTNELPNNSKITGCFICSYDEGYYIGSTSLLNYIQYCKLYQNDLILCSHGNFISKQVLNKFNFKSKDHETKCCACAFKLGFEDGALITARTSIFSNSSYQFNSRITR